MKINTRLVPFLLGVAALTLTGVGVARGGDQLDAATQARIARFEKGPSTIDVSKYPDGIKSDYEVFSHKCSQCHRLSRPINSDYATPDEWSRYVKRMMHKPGSGIGRSEAKKIYDFLVYDSSVRKKKLLDEKLAKLPADQKAEQEKKIAQVHKEFDNQ